VFDFFFFFFFGVSNEAGKMGECRHARGLTKLRRSHAVSRNDQIESIEAAG
jgi:hypothetical protein